MDKDFLDEFLKDFSNKIDDMLEADSSTPLSTVAMSKLNKLGFCKHSFLERLNKLLSLDEADYEHYKPYYTKIIELSKELIEVLEKFMKED